MAYISFCRPASLGENGSLRDVQRGFIHSCDVWPQISANYFKIVFHFEIYARSQKMEGPDGKLTLTRRWFPLSLKVLERQHFKRWDAQSCSTWTTRTAKKKGGNPPI